ncbi:MAG TPA: serine/threonine-protein kinase, partial [Flavobacteriales bacterium]|nr:serine/threonine-protein kinase [Flavobacteriales bacterium]
MADHQKYILKILKDDYPSAEEIFRFQQEYEITKGLVFDGLRRVHKYEKINSRHSLLMEYFSGQSLRRLIQQGKIDNLRIFLELAISIADVVHKIHQQGIIHKDIKPDNLLAEIETADIRLIDFGLATRITLKNASLTPPEKLEGTLAYISPEQTGRMNRTVDYRSDFYSLGITFYEMMTGQLPFIATDSLELVHCHIAKKPV